METTSSIKAKPITELLPCLSGILTKEAMLTFTAKKEPCRPIAQTRTAEKSIKPLTMAEMKSVISALKGQTPKNVAPAATSIRKKLWNSSVKVDKKTISHTANRPLKNNPVRKVLNFQVKSKEVTNIKSTITPAPPKFQKPEFRAKKSVVLQAQNNIRISGISNISETPVINKPIRNRMTLANKENIPHQSGIKKALPCNIEHKKLATAIPDTPVSNESWKSSCDASFLQKEKEINDAITTSDVLIKEKTLENIAEITPPVSTPFREYRDVQEFFNQSCDIDSYTTYQDNTIMELEPAKYIKREDSVIVSLCNLLNKTSVNGPQNNTELDNLLQIEKQFQENINRIENVIDALNKIKQSQMVSLQSVKKLIQDKKITPERNVDKTLIEAKEITNDVKAESTTRTAPFYDRVSKPCSVITSAKSPSYKIPKKNMSLRKKVYCKSMPNVVNENDIDMPGKEAMGNRALSMYMNIKQHLNFLNTPVTKRRLDEPDTPGVMSHNLQNQLNKLYGDE